MTNELHPQTVELLKRIDQRLALLDLSDNAASERAGLGRDAIRNLRRGAQRELSAVNASKMAAALEISVGQLIGTEPMPEFFGVRPEKTARRRAAPKAEVFKPFQPPEISKRRIPILGVAVGGDDGRFIMNGEVIDTTFCPPGYEDVPDVYAVFVSGSSMEPRFEPGETVWVHPRKPPRKGNYVVVQVHGSPDEPPEGFIKRFVKWTVSSLILEQLNPAGEIEFDRDNVISVHPIVFQGMG